MLRPTEYTVFTTLNLNGDDISDALAAQVGGIGIDPGANLLDLITCFEATHGTAHKNAGKDCVNPGSEILSAKMMLCPMRWAEAADWILLSMACAIDSKNVTYGFAPLMEGATQVSCSGFGQVMIDPMWSGAWWLMWPASPGLFWARDFLCGFIDRQQHPPPHGVVSVQPLDRYWRHP